MKKFVIICVTIILIFCCVKFWYVLLDNSDKIASIDKIEKVSEPTTVKTGLLKQVLTKEQVQLDCVTKEKDWSITYKGTTYFFRPSKFSVYFFTNEQTQRYHASISSEDFYGSKYAVGDSIIVMKREYYILGEVHLFDKWVVVENN